MLNQPTLRMIQRKKELLGRRGLKKQAPIMTYPKVIEKKYQAELINFVNVLANEINNRLIDNLEQIERQKNIELNLDSWVDSVDEIFTALKVWGIAKASEMLSVITLKASQIGDWNEKEFKRSIKTVVGVDPISKNQGYQTLIQSWAKENATLISSIQSTLLDDVAGVTQRGMSAGKSINDISKEIKDRYGVTKSRARLIARTEVGKLNGNLSKYRNEELGIKTYFWATSNDEKVRDSHRALNGKLCRWDDDSVYSEDNGKSWKKRTGKMFRGKPGDDFQCFPEYEKLTGTPLPYKLYRRDYKGELIKINLASGKRITATPNHPIATNRGIIPIKDITKFDYIIGKSQEMCSFTKFNGKHFIPTFGQIFSSFCESGVSFSVSPDKRSQFHGDGSYGKINIIGIDSLLISVRNSLFNEKLPKFGFTESDMMVCDALFSSNSNLYSSFKARRYAESRIVSSLDLICSLFESHLTPLEQFALALGSDADIIISESFSNSTSTNSIMFRDRIFAFSALVFGYNFVRWQRDNFLSRAGKFIDSYATSFEVFTDSCGTEASFLRNTFNSISESVEFDKVVDISLFDYDGHVFNLSNISGYYTVNNLNVSNCRCTSRSNVNQLLEELGI